jgi:IMP dehydrogenase/GMP reductase
MKQGLTFDDVAMVPVFNNVESRTDPDVSTKLTSGVSMYIPIVASNMDSVIGPDLAKVLVDAGSVPIFHRFTTFENKVTWINDFPSAFISCGIRAGDVVELDKLLEETELRGVCFDIAHGHDSRLLETIDKLKNKYTELEVIAGNVCTADAYRDLVNAGATAIKVGIGPGAACTTRKVTGFGVPQFTAIQDIAAVKKKLLVPIIADGGIRGSSDIVKALAAGADSVMIGKLFALTDESAAPKRWTPPTNVSYGPPILAAKYRGQASADFQEDYFGATKDGTVPEGEAFWASVSGPAIDTIQRLLAGLRSGMTYGGARSIGELQRKAEFIQVTGHYAAESAPRP